MKKSKDHVTCTAEQFNSLVDEFDADGVDYRFIPYAYAAHLETARYIYECSLLPSGEKPINVGSICTSFYNKCKFDDLKDKYGYKEIYDSIGRKHILWDYGVASGYQYSDPYYSRKNLICWSYDVHSSYSFAMLNKMPDTSKEPRYNDEVKENEIGFYKMGGATTDVGDIADIIFPLMDSPFKEYIYNYYDKKKVATGVDRQKYKDFLNIPTGILERKNIFIRNAIIYYSNKYIKKYIDDDTVYCNVDCIVSLKPRYDLPIGEEIGQFAEEHRCEPFKYIKNCQYQWGKECHYSGIPQNTIEDIEDLSHWQDKLPYKIIGKKVYKNENRK